MTGRQLRKLLADARRLERAVDRLTVAVLDLFITGRPGSA